MASQPGLTIALVVGVTAAKTLSLMWGKPLIGHLGPGTRISRVPGSQHGR